MRTKCLTLLLLVGTLLLSSCSLGGGRTIIYDDSDKKADDLLKQILDTLENQDQDALKAMFSKKALNEANDFDGSMEYLFGLFQGNVESWERDRFSSDASIEDGKKSKRLLSWYTVTTDKGKYRFYLSDFIVDTIDPDNAGLYTLHVISAEEADEESPFIINWDYKDIPGIYKPEE
jgi:hypothetical protein